jgi:polyisoprenoid-binding protein YceI
MKKVFLFLLISLIYRIAAAQGFDPAQSRIEFEAENMWVNTVEGTIKGWKGKVTFDPENPGASSFDVRAEVATIHTGNEERDEHLRSVDFFETEKFPEMRFKSEDVKKTSENQYQVTGKLTIKDVTRGVSMPFTVDDNQLTGTLSINRHDYKVGEDQGNFGVGKTIEVKVICVMTR